MTTNNNPQTLAIGVDLGGTKIACGLCRGADILQEVVVPTPFEQGAQAVVDAIAGAIRELLPKGDNERKAIRGIGIGAAGQIDSQTGTVIYAPNLRWNNVPLGGSLTSALGLPVRIVNDVRAATVAELRYGAGRGLSDFVNIFLGTGVGSGLVIGGRIVEGATNSAGEIGHLCLDPDGPKCGCGHRGCFEAYGSGTGLTRYVVEHLETGAQSKVRDLVGGDLAKVNGPIIGEAARAGDRLALEGLTVVGRSVGLVVANLHTFINPQTVLRGGGLMALKEFFLPTLHETLQHIVLPVAKRDGLVREAHFGNKSGLIGGAALFAES